MLEELRVGCLVLVSLAALAFTALLALLVLGDTSQLVLTNPTARTQKVQVQLLSGRELFLGEVRSGETITSIVPFADDQAGLNVTTQSGRFVCSEYLTHPESWRLSLGDPPALGVSGHATRCTP